MVGVCTFCRMAYRDIILIYALENLRAIVFFVFVA